MKKMLLYFHYYFDALKDELEGYFRIVVLVAVHDSLQCAKHFHPPKHAEYFQATHHCEQLHWGIISIGVL